MVISFSKYWSRLAAICTVTLLLPVPSAFAMAAPALESSYLYNLSSFNGPLPMEWVALANDDVWQEIYICNPAESSVVIFNAQGMEVFRFGNDRHLKRMSDLVVLADGDMLILSVDADGQPMLVSCNYRGVVESVRPVPVPSEIAAFFRPSRLIVQEQRLYLIDLSGMMLLETTLEGATRAIHNLGERVGLNRNQIENTGLGGVAIHEDGTIFFTIPVQFKVFRLGIDGELGSFGQAGSSPGRFGVIAGIATDSRGSLYVVDTLRCVVIAFGPDFQFKGEIGQRGVGPGELIAPKELVVAADGKVYVTQMGKRGVNVYRVPPG